MKRTILTVVLLVLAVLAFPFNHTPSVHAEPTCIGLDVPIHGLFETNGDTILIHDVLWCGIEAPTHIIRQPCTM